MNLLLVVFVLGIEIMYDSSIENIFKVENVRGKNK